VELYERVEALEVALKAIDEKLILHDTMLATLHGITKTLKEKVLEQRHPTLIVSDRQVRAPGEHGPQEIQAAGD
jgi:hypothetical protein